MATNGLTHLDTHNHFNDLGVSSEYIKRTLNPKYFTHTERFIHYPGINGDIAVSTNLAWEVIGDNSTSALATFRTGGGVTLTTAGADEDQMILQSHKDTKQSGLAAINWSTELQPYIRADIETAADIDDMVVWCGFRSTDSLSEATAALVIADADDQFMFLYGDTGTTYTSTWQAVSSRSGTDTQTNSLKFSNDSTSGVTVEASTLYRLEAWLDRDRVPHYYINGIKVATADNTALDAATTTLDPYIGVMEEGSGAARAISIRSFTVSQLYT